MGRASQILLPQSCLEDAQRAVDACSSAAACYTQHDAGPIVLKVAPQWTSAPTACGKGSEIRRIIPRARLIAA
jgi:hypothetical protein